MFGIDVRLCASMIVVILELVFAALGCMFVFFFNDTATTEIYTE